MPTVSIRELADKTSAVVHQVNSTGRPAVITNRGKPVAIVVPFDEDAFEDWLLSNAPQFVEAMDEADKYAAAGKGASWDDLGKLL
ncbi:MAG: type II toxin-antitoxin system Phd/YefM family antitoxin [Acidimicrobiia bacterium]